VLTAAAVRGARDELNGLACIGLGRAGLGRQLVARGGGCVARRLAVVAAEGDDTFARPRIWSEDAVVAVTIADELEDQIMTSS
jgi:hypothetical protein